MASGRPGVATIGPADHRRADLPPADLPADLSAADLDALELDLLRSVCADSFADFVRNGWHVIEPTRPLLPSVAFDAVCAGLQAVADGLIKRLVITMPPGVGKSKLAAVAFPAYMLLRTLGKARVMVGSYSFGFACRDSKFCRDLVISEWYQRLVGDAWKIRDDANTQEDWHTSATGRRLVSSVSGKATGERCTIQIIDDALNAIDADSPAALREALRWVNTVLPSRLEDQRSDARVIVGQRLAKNDPPGDAIAKGWKHLNLPIVLEEGDEPCVLVDDSGTMEIWRDTRALGVPLVELFDDEALRRLEHDELGPTAYATQYKQKPADDSASWFKRDWLRRRWIAPGQAPPVLADDAPPITELPEFFDREIITVDCSFKETATSDYAVIQRWGAHGGDRFLLDQWRKRAGAAETEEVLLEWHRKHPLLGIYIEEAANGHAIIDRLRKVIAGIIAIPPNESGTGARGKAGRWRSVEAIVRSGAVVLPAYAPWLQVWLDEICSTCGPVEGVKDDQIDAFAYALRELQTDGTEVDVATVGPQVFERR